MDKQQSDELMLHLRHYDQRVFCINEPDSDKRAPNRDTVTHVIKVKFQTNDKSSFLVIHSAPGTFHARRIYKLCDALSDTFVIQLKHGTKINVRINGRERDFIVGDSKIDMRGQKLDDGSWDAYVWFDPERPLAPIPTRANGLIGRASKQEKARLETLLQKAKKLERLYKGKSATHPLDKEYNAEF
jgi:hypothetical protein